MKSLAALVVAFVLASSALSAQTVERSIDLVQLGWGAIQATSVDVDGDPGTEEWLVSRLNEWSVTEYRVVAICGGRFVSGDWFTIGATRPVDIVTLLGRSKMLIQGTYDGSVSEPLLVIGLTMPACITGSR